MLTELFHDYGFILVEGLLAVIAVVWVGLKIR